MEGLGYKKWAVPFLVFDINSITVFVGSSLMAKFIALIKVTQTGKILPLKTYVYNNILVPWAEPLNGSLAYALIIILIWFGIMTPFYRKKIFIKI